MNVRYTQAERDYIAARLGHEPLAAIAAALGRTELGLEEYLKGRRHSAPTPPARCARVATRSGGPSIPELARVLGVGSGMVRRWVAEGLLRTETRYERRKAVVIIPRAAVRRLIAGGALIDTASDPAAELVALRDEVRRLREGQANALVIIDEQAPALTGWRARDVMAALRAALEVTK